MFDKYEEQEKDRILQCINDLLEKYDWGGMSEKTVIRLRFKGKFFMLDPDVQLKETSNDINYGC